MAKARIELPPKLVPVFSPSRGSVQYRASYGGRGSGKSFSFAKMAAVWGYAEPLRVLCAREFQNSIKESFHAELKAAIDSEPWLADFYDVGEDYLRGPNGTTFIFKGLRRNVATLKSLAKIDLTIVEEAEDAPEASWLALEATVFRQPKSELWAIWNPRDEGSPVDRRFRQTPPESALITKLNFNDNPWFPPGLEQLRQRHRELLDAATYSHIWEGEYLLNSDAQVFANKWRVAEFEPGDWDGPYHGLDFGYSQDPTAAVRCWIHDDCLWIERETGGTGIEIDETAPVLIRDIPGIENYELLADSSQPSMVEYLTRHGLPRCKSVYKWQGSVEDGVRFIRSFREVVIHPRCKETAREFRLYSYKVDERSGQILPKLVDAHNHYIDATRYALQPQIRKRDVCFSDIRMI